jgi:hypothetical protein
MVMRLAAIQENRPSIRHAPLRNHHEYKSNFFLIFFFHIVTTLLYYVYIWI